MKTLLFFLLFCLACTKIEYIEQQVQSNDSLIIANAKKISEIKPITQIDTIVIRDTVFIVRQVTTRDTVFIKDTVFTIRETVTKDTIFVMVKPVTTVTDIDGNVYNTMVIGSQMWTCENLRVTRFNDGTPIKNAVSDSAWANTSGGPAYCDEYYNFQAVYTDGSKDDKLCPVGWHVSSDADWMLLEQTLGVPDSELTTFGVQGTVIAYWLAQSAFKAKFDHQKSSSWVADGFGHYAIWWSNMFALNQLTYYSALPIVREIEIFSGSISRNNEELMSNLGHSVRCVKNSLLK
jgi:uncharacterized protein (TIGR02145 family)